MSATANWLEAIRALPEDRVEVLRCISEEKTNVEIADELGKDEVEVEEIITEICSTLSLGPFTDSDEERRVLGEIYREHCSPKEQPPDDPAAEPRKDPASRKRQGPSGIVVEIPPDTVAIDVLTGQMPEDGFEAEEIAAAIKERRELRLKPAYLVLTPSSVDPSLTNFQLIFFEREHS